MDNVKISAGQIFVWGLAIVGALLLIVAVGFSFVAAGKSFSRYQKLADERNEVLVNEIRINQQAQLITVEKQKAQIRVQEAIGIASAQKIINATLTDKYLQHEAISAQKSLADSPNHTTIYIPSGQNGIPIIKTDDGK